MDFISSKGKEMTMQSLGLIAALAAGSMAADGAYNPFDNRFEVHVGVSDRPRGKRKDVSWRTSKGYNSRKARANRRKRR